MESRPEESLPPCSEQEIKDDLERLLASREFAHTDRLSRFLRFVVERTIAGDRDSLKESVVGAAVYDRPPGYDPKAEPIVRTEARRLRAKLAEYYQNSGRDARVQISMPTGGYMAAFDRRYPAPRLAVLPKPVIPMPPAMEASAPTAARAPAPAAVAVAPARPPRAAWLPVGLAVAALALTGAGLLVWHYKQPLTNTEFVLSTVTSYPGAQYTPAISPDGRQVAFAWSDDKTRNTDIYVSAADGSSPRRLTTAHGGDTLPAWSHDGSQIAFVRHSHLLVVSPSSGGEKELGNAFPSWVSWSPEANSVLIADWIPGRNVLAIFAVDAASGARRQITFPPADPVITGDTAAALSPDGARLAFIRCNLKNCDLYAAPYAGGEMRRLTHDECEFAGLTWLPDGRSIVFSSRRRGPFALWRVSASGGEPVPIAPAGVDARNPGAARGPSGKVRIVFDHRVTIGNVWRQRLDSGVASSSSTSPGSTSPPERLMASTGLDSSPQFSPDGKQVVFSSDRTGYDEIWAADADGANQRALTHMREEPGSPRWAPDGHRIAFDVLEKHGRAIFLTDIQGSAPQQWTPWGNASRPSWSRDGKWIYYGESDSTGVPQVWRISTAPDRTITQLTHDGGFEAYESPDGKTLYYTVGGRELRRMSPEGGPWTRVTDLPVRHGWWGVAERGIYFADLPEPKANIYDDPFPVLMFDFASGKAHPVAAIKGPVNRSTPDFAVSFDGRTLLYCILDVSTSQIRMVEAL